MSEQKNTADVILSGGNSLIGLKEKKQRRVDIDIIRILACFLVVFHHTKGYQVFAHADSYSQAWGYSLVSILTRMNVPLFFMVSGALLLKNKNESYWYIFKHRILKIVIILPLLVTMLTAIGAFRGYIDGFSLETCIRFILDESNRVGGGLYWYLYSYLGILLMLPFYRRMANGMTKQDFLMLFFIHFFYYSVFEVANQYFAYRHIETVYINASFLHGVCMAMEQQLFYPLIGFYLDHNIDIRKASRKKLYLVFGGGIVGVLISSGVKLVELKIYGMTFTEEFLMLFDYMTAISMFLLIKYLCAKLDQLASHKRLVMAISTVGALTYGIYLFEPFMKWAVYSRFVALISKNPYRIYPNLIYCILSMTVTGAIAWCIKKIPVIKKLL